MPRKKKTAAPAAEQAEPASAKRNLLDDSGSDSEDGGADLGSLKVNEEYARRFEHNKKREELHRLEEKYKKNKAAGSDDDDDASSSSSTDETEDEDGFLATEELDAQISATLQAIRNKDPRVYDKQTTFFQPGDDGADPAPSKPKDKPLYLRDYHRQKIMSGDAGASDDEADPSSRQKTSRPPLTYQQEQDALKKSVVSEINAAMASGSEQESDGDDDFVKRKPGAANGKKAAQPDANGMHPDRAVAVATTTTTKQLTEADVENADKNPELFLSNFLAARAWVQEDGQGVHNWKPFESDEGSADEADRADEFEHAYNMRFEDPAKSNEMLKSYDRSMAASKSVRREKATGRQRQRELEKQRKDAEKEQRREERARLRRLKIDEAEAKLAKIRHAAGASGRDVPEEDWVKFLDDAWDDDKWEEEMKKRFGEDYYAQEDDGGEVAASEDSDEDNAAADADAPKKKKKGPRKPKWDDDIDINDLIPDFKAEEPRPDLVLTDNEDGAPQTSAGQVSAAALSSLPIEEEEEEDEQGEEPPSKKRKTQKDHKKARLEARKAAKAQRARIEAIVDAHMDLDHPSLLLPSGNPLDQSQPEQKKQQQQQSSFFRYRETSPTSFGLTARDILLAPSDADLNQFAGIKKLATFRDPERKRKDRQRLGKKARLRKWRREVFGKEFERTGPAFPALATSSAADAQETKPPAAVPDADARGETGGGEDGQVGEMKKNKRKRKRSKKAGTAEEAGGGEAMEA